MPSTGFESSASPSLTSLLLPGALVSQAPILTVTDHKKRKGAACTTPVRPMQPSSVCLGDDFGDDPSANRAAALPHREAKLLLHCDRRYQLHLDGHVVP